MTPTPSLINGKEGSQDPAFTLFPFRNGAMYPQKKGPSESERPFSNSNSDRSRELLLRFRLCWCCGFRSCRLSRRRLRCSRLHRIVLIEKTDNFLRHVDLVCSVNDRRVLCGRIENHSIS